MALRPSLSVFLCTILFSGMVSAGDRPPPPPDLLALPVLLAATQPDEAQTRQLCGVLASRHDERVNAQRELMHSQRALAALLLSPDDDDARNRAIAAQVHASERLAAMQADLARQAGALLDAQQRERILTLLDQPPAAPERGSRPKPLPCPQFAAPLQER